MTTNTDEIKVTRIELDRYETVPELTEDLLVQAITLALQREVDLGRIGEGQEGWVEYADEEIVVLAGGPHLFDTASIELGDVPDWVLEEAFTKTVSAHVEIARQAIDETRIQSVQSSSYVAVLKRY